MLIIALVLALIGLVALVFAVVTSNELVAWVCIGASVVGVVLLIIDAVRERQQRDTGGDTAEDEATAEDHGRDTVDYPEEGSEEASEEAAEQTPADAAREPHDAADESQGSTVAADGRGDEPAK